ncbi:Hypothetical_protein [Hexamita inflata]|uniref:Hypothetical_protein n=1 Tax=Hexamita inflata TaxID=28002 RepID=A0AA86NW03_9EUKA|nr:Hypothetical protein HINF_LOCUS13419 [Hexamita inflata]
MVNKIVDLVLNIITAIILGLLDLSSLIVMFTYTDAISVDYYFKVLFLIVCCVFQAISPWIKFTQEQFKFMTSPFWRAGFVFMLGMFQFPSFDSLYWEYGSFVFQNVCAISVMVLGIAYLVVDIVDYQTTENQTKQYSEVNEA